MGDEDAEVTMEVWCDVQGPFCKEFDNNAFAQIQSEYVEHGKVKVVWKDNPHEQIHPWAMEGATAMECVHRESDSVFWQVLDRVYENQDSLNNETVQEEITEYAGETSVDEDSIQTCLSKEPSDEVLSDIEEAGSRNISATPTVIIEGQRI
jgi:protein-disulfide isomerase